MSTRQGSESCEACSCPLPSTTGQVVSMSRTAQASRTGGTEKAAAAQPPPPRAAAAPAEAVGMGGVNHTGSLVVYDAGSHQYKLGMVVAREAKSWLLVTKRGARKTVKPSFIALVLPGTDHTLADMVKLETAAAAADGPAVLQRAWAATAGTEQRYSLPELTQLMFGSTSALRLYVTIRVLQQHPQYFEQAPNELVWTPRTAEQLTVEAQRTAAQRAEDADKKAWLRAVEAARSRKQGGRCQTLQEWLQGPHAERMLAVQAVALNRNPSEEQQVLARQSLTSVRVFQGRDTPLADVAAALLVAVGVLDRSSPLVLLRAGVDVAFSTQLEVEAQALIEDDVPDADAESRIDLCHLTTYAISEADVIEVESAVSIEVNGDGSRKLWVHVADPTRWLTMGSAMDAEARLRQRTVALPWGSVPLFPTSLGAHLFSLRGGDDGWYAMSVCAELNADGSLSTWQVMPSIVRVTHSLTPAGVDQELLSGGVRHPQLLQLYHAARARQMHRISCGAADIQLPESKVIVPAEDLSCKEPRITIKQTSPWCSASRLLLDELLLLAGEAVGALGAAEGLPLPYKGQQPANLPPEHELEALPDGPCKSYRLRRCMPPTMMSAFPVPNSGLGLQEYATFTSPLHSYADLLAHWNIKALLRGERPPFTAADIRRIMVAGAARAREVTHAESALKQAWVAQYMAQHKLDSWRAVVLECYKQDVVVAVVLLEELGLEAVMQVHEAMWPSERLVVKLAEVDAAAGVWKLRKKQLLDSELTRSRRTRTGATAAAGRAAAALASARREAEAAAQAAAALACAADGDPQQLAQDGPGFSARMAAAAAAAAAGCAAALHRTTATGAAVAELVAAADLEQQCSSATAAVGSTGGTASTGTTPDAQTAEFDYKAAGSADDAGAKLFLLSLSSSLSSNSDRAAQDVHSERPASLDSNGELAGWAAAEAAAEALLNSPMKREQSLAALGVIAAEGEEDPGWAAAIAAAEEVLESPCREHPPQQQQQSRTTW